MLGITVFSFITLVPALVRGAEVGGIEGQVSTAANGEESYVATWRIAGRKRDAAGVLQPVPWTTQTTKILKDDPMPTLVYNCAMLPHICKNVEDHPTYGGNSDKTVCTPLRLMNVTDRACSSYTIHTTSERSFAATLPVRQLGLRVNRS